MNATEKNAVIVSLMPYLQRRARALAGRSILDAEDLAQEAALKTLTMLDDANDMGEHQLQQRCRRRAEWAMRDAIRHSSATPRSRHDRARMLHYVEGRLSLELNRPPTAEEIADELGMTPAELDHYRTLSRPLQVVSTEQPAGEAHTIADLLAAEGISPEERMALLQSAARIREHIAALPTRERMVLELHEFEGLTNAQIGERLGVTPSRISQLRRRARQMLGELLAPAQQTA